MPSRTSNLAGFTTSISSTTDLNVGVVTAVTISAGTVTATSFSGSGANLTGLPSGYTDFHSKRKMVTDQLLLVP